MPDTPKNPHIRVLQRRPSVRYPSALFQFDIPARDVCEMLAKCAGTWKDTRKSWRAGRFTHAR